MDPCKDGKTTFPIKTLTAGKVPVHWYLFFPPSSNFSRIMSTIYTTQYKSSEFLCFITYGIFQRQRMAGGMFIIKHRCLHATSESSCKSQNQMTDLKGGELFHYLAHTQCGYLSLGKCPSRTHSSC